jgi:GTP cyclohydrolase I
MKSKSPPTTGSRPSKEAAEGAVRTLIEWAGDDPAREGLLGTPDRVVRAYDEFYRGYQEDPVAILRKATEPAHGYDDMVLLRGIRFSSHCEHHMITIIGVAHVAYVPNEQMVGISKIARVVDVFARRLQIQEAMTSQIAAAIDEAVAPRGVAVLIDAEHQCMTTRGVQRPGVTTVTTHVTGCFKSDPMRRREFVEVATRSPR